MRIRISPELGRRVGAPLATLLARTWSIRAIGSDRWLSARATGRPLVFMCWHEALLPLLWWHRGQGIAIVVSEARDGQYLADLAARLGYRLVRGSSTRGATRALLGAVRELREGISVAFTPDGPRGPRRELKPGVVAAAQRGGGIVVPVHAEADRAWRLGSWDRFMLPKPLARVRVAYGPPFEVAPGPAGLEEGLARAREALEAARRLAGCSDDGATRIG
ncbi:MAG TPA: lysophospholipid acyltransferase family protein [Gemmatimonadales bacterium]|nr:lysophospholipid acyltransferase family protein [Gemmatimonadales bacterium]